MARLYCFFTCPFLSGRFTQNLLLSRPNSAALLRSFALHRSEQIIRPTPATPVDRSLTAPDSRPALRLSPWLRFSYPVACALPLALQPAAQRRNGTAPRPSSPS